MPKIEVEVSLTDILDYADSKAVLEEGEALYKEGRIVTCSFEQIDKITCFCRSRSGGLHKVIIILDNVARLNCACSCKSGKEQECAYVIATLIHLNRCGELDYNVDDDKKEENSSNVEPFSNFCHPLAKNEKLQCISSPEVDAQNSALLSLLSQINGN